MSHHLGYPAGAEKPESATNHRNGKSGKTVLTDEGPLRIEVPRDREGEFEPKLIGKHERLPEDLPQLVPVEGTRQIFQLRGPA